MKAKALVTAAFYKWLQVTNGQICTENADDPYTIVRSQITW